MQPFFGDRVAIRFPLTCVENWNRRIDNEFCDVMETIIKIIVIEMNEAILIYGTERPIFHQLEATKHKSNVEIEADK